MPYQPETGLGAKSNDPYSFVPYKTAVQASGYDGIGIGIFNGICAIDLDNCVSDSGYYTQTAAEIVALMHSYTEYSPSGNGLHKEELNYTDMGKRLGDQRNHFAHGDLDKDFIGLSLLDLIFLQRIIYAMQLKISGLEDKQIQRAINDLFQCRFAI